MVINHTTQVGNPIIRRKARRVPLSSKTTRKIVRNLIDSMRYHGLVGMAAPQIGISRRIFVSEIKKTKTRSQRETDLVRVFVNPRIISFSRKQVFGYEGCGSVANSGLFGNVRACSKSHAEAGSRDSSRKARLAGRRVRGTTTRRKRFAGGILGRRPASPTFSAFLAVRF